MKREPAWRVFAGEYNDATYEIKGEAEMAPSYIVTPLGAKINRVFVIGVLTDIENVSEGRDLVRARISDPTGVFTVYSGSYQKVVTDALSNIEAPAFVAVIGKVRTYSPEEGTLYVSIRPEKIMEVTAIVRDKWILETCKNTKDRIEAVLEAMKMEDSNEFELKKLGYSKELCEGIIAAIKHYEHIDLEKYVRLIHESLQYLTPGKKELPDLKTKEDKVEKDQTKIKTTENEISEEPDISIQETEKPMETNAIAIKEEEEQSSDFIETEDTVLSIIKENEGENGAQWDTITEKCSKKGIDRDNVEEALTSLMDKGLVYEPVLGIIKST
jgi:RPA family protein